MRHAELTASVYAAVGAALRGAPCHAYSSDLKICVAENTLYTYADMTVVCSPLQRSRRDHNAVMNAAVIVEVLSDTTEAYDRGEKFSAYRRIPTLRDYLLVSHNRVAIEHFHRCEDGSWTLRMLKADDTLNLDSIGISVRVAEIYEGVSLLPGRWGPRNQLGDVSRG